MILAVSTSHSVSSVALIDGEEIVKSDQRHAPRAASAACLDMLTAFDLSGVDEGFVADIGPGSFTGIKVGVTMVKMFAWLRGLPVAGVSSFDLISLDGPAKVSAKKGEYWIRRPGEAATLVADSSMDPTALPPPLAERTVHVVGRLVWIAPELLVPDYHAEPSISQPNRPYREARPCP